MVESSVGQGARNDPNDTCIVQSALNVWLSSQGERWIAIDGLVGPQTAGTIKRFQRTNRLPVDGRIDVGGPTIAMLKSLVGEVAVFAPVVSELLDVADVATMLAAEAPLKLRRHYGLLTHQLNVLRRYSDLARNLDPESPIVLPARFPQPGVIGVTGVEELGAAILLFIFFVAVIVIMTQSPAFRKAVEVRAKELDRLMGELKIHMNVGFKEQVAIIEGEAVDQADRCKQAPTFTPSPECSEAMKALRAIQARMNKQLEHVGMEILLFAEGHGRGQSLSSLRTEINRPRFVAAERLGNPDPPVRDARKVQLPRSLVLKTMAWRLSSVIGR
jgi:Putative peptidoglycan binding domain